MQTIAIKDANILIDCVDIDILATVFQLPLVFKTTDFIWAEITSTTQRQAVQTFIDNGQLIVERFSPQEVIEISALSVQYSGISFEDSSAMYLAQQQSAILLSGDGKLRTVCQAAKIRVHGILWLLDQIHAEGLISTAVACEKIKRLQSTNPRLPRLAIQERVRRWCGE
jgi:predicted nucleic acid-binding protein